MQRTRLVAIIVVAAIVTLAGLAAFAPTAFGYPTEDSGIGSVPLEIGVASLKTIYANPGSYTNHQCIDTEWHSSSPRCRTRPAARRPFTCAGTTAQLGMQISGSTRAAPATT